MTIEEQAEAYAKSKLITHPAPDDYYYPNRAVMEIANKNLVRGYIAGSSAQKQQIIELLEGQFSPLIGLIANRHNMEIENLINLINQLS